MHDYVNLLHVVSSCPYDRAMSKLYHVQVAFGFFVAIVIIFRMVAGIILGVLLWMSCCYEDLMLIPV